MEIIVLPYLAISFAIAWAVFSPFSTIDDIHEWTFDKVEIGDLFAVFLPIGFLLAFTIWAIPTDSISVVNLSLILSAILLFSFSGLLTGLYLFAKLNRIHSVKRMTIIGIIVPIGSFLTFGWVVFPLAGMASSEGSILLAIPATIVVLPVTWVLRSLSQWVCRPASDGRIGKRDDAVGNSTDIELRAAEKGE